MNLNILDPIKLDLDLNYDKLKIDDDIPFQFVPKNKNSQKYQQPVPKYSNPIKELIYINWKNFGKCGSGSECEKCNKHSAKVRF